MKKRLRQFTQFEDTIGTLLEQAKEIVEAVRNYGELEVKSEQKRQNRSLCSATLQSKKCNI
jgi:hypothetical protein